MLKPDAEAEYRHERGKANIDLEELLKPHHAGILRLRERLHAIKVAGAAADLDRVRGHLKQASRAMDQGVSDWFRAACGDATVDAQAAKFGRKL